MICRKCGELLGDYARRCPVCGAAQQSAKVRRTILNPVHAHGKDCTTAGHSPAPASIGLTDALRLFFRNAANFSGRSGRSEYWWVFLFNMAVFTLLAITLPDITGIWTLVMFFPCLALGVRRLHDIGKSGWWYLAGFVPLVGGILLIVWFARDSQPGRNRWGSCPKL